MENISGGNYSHGMRVAGMMLDYGQAADVSFGHKCRCLGNGCMRFNRHQIPRYPYIIKLYGDLIFPLDRDIVCQINAGMTYNLCCKYS